MLPVGTCVKVTYPDRSASFAAWTYMNQEGVTQPADEYITETQSQQFTQVKLDNGVSCYFYDRELQVVQVQPWTYVVNGRVTIGDTVCWPQRTGSSMWMVVGTVVDIHRTISDVSPMGDMAAVGDGTFSMMLQINKSETKITIVTADGVKKSTKSIDRVVKTCPTTT